MTPFSQVGFTSRTIQLNQFTQVGFTRRTTQLNQLGILTVSTVGT